MSEEEKKAIKALKIFNKIVEMVKFNYMGLDEEEKEFVNNNDYVYNTKKSIITVLNLIEKQQKEIDELRKENIKWKESAEYNYEQYQDIGKSCFDLQEIEKLHKEENGKLRMELEQEKEKNERLNAVLDVRFIHISGGRTFYNRLDGLPKIEIIKLALGLRNELESLIKEKNNYISKERIMQEIKNIEKRMETATNSTEYQKLHCAQEYLRGLFWEV